VLQSLALVIGFGERNALNPVDWIELWITQIAILRDPSFTPNLLACLVQRPMT
jgi:hypothetical protein